MVERYLESGQTQRVYAREAGISVSSLQSWLRQAGEEIQAPAERAMPVSLLEVELDRAARGALRGEDGGREYGGMPYEIVYDQMKRFANKLIPRLKA